MEELKDKLIKQINDSNDIDLLNQLSDFLTSINSNYVIELNEDQIKSIEISKKQIENGQFSTHEDVMKMFDSND